MRALHLCRISRMRAHRLHLLLAGMDRTPGSTRGLLRTHVVRRAGTEKLDLTIIRRAIIRELTRTTLQLGIAVALVMAGLLIGPSAARAAERNLLNNGDFARGSGSSCDGWRVDAWILSPTATEFTWIPRKGAEPA